MYNLDLARKLSNKIDHVYLVEGYMDVVGLSKNKIENVAVKKLKNFPINLTLELIGLILSD